MNGLDSSHTAAPDTARHQGAGPARVPAHSPRRGGRPRRAGGQPVSLHVVSDQVADEFTAAILEPKPMARQRGIRHGAPVYDPFVGSSTTPAVAVRLAQPRRGAAA